MKRVLEIFVKMPMEILPPEKGDYMLIRQNNISWVCYMGTFDGTEWVNVGRFYTHWLKYEKI